MRKCVESIKSSVKLIFSFCRNILVIWLLIFSSFNGVLADQVSCEKIENYTRGWGNLKTCFMNETTKVTSVDTTIASQDESIEVLFFYFNKKIKFLPIEVNEKLSNLVQIQAAYCSLTTISKANFKGLSKLRVLSLYMNQIGKIRSDVFDDLVALNYLYLSKFTLNYF